MNHPPLEFKDDWLTVSGEHDPLAFARWLESIDPATFTWQAGKPSKFYSSSLIAPGGIQLQYGPKADLSRDLDCPQSDTRDSSGFSLEVPGDPASGLLDVLRTHPRHQAMQLSRRDIAATFKPEAPAQVYAMFRDLVWNNFNRPAWRIGPDGEDWERVTLQTHEAMRKADRAVILYHKHAESPDEYPDPNALRLEFRFCPAKKHAKRLLFTSSTMDVLSTWRFARTVIEAIWLEPMDPSPLVWRPPTSEGDLDRMTAYLLASYGPTIFRGIAARGPDYLHSLAIAAALQAAPRDLEAPFQRPAVPSAPASDVNEAVPAFVPTP